jgi:hypothetical protein
MRLNSRILCAGGISLLLLASPLALAQEQDEGAEETAAEASEAPDSAGTVVSEAAKGLESIEDPQEKAAAARALGGLAVQNTPAAGKRPDLPEQARRAGRPETAGRPDFAGRPERPERPDRAERPQRPERPETPGRPEIPGRPGG